MKNIIKSVRLDNYILKKFYLLFLLVYAIGIALAIISQQPVLVVVLVVFISAPIVGVFFNIYERNNLSKLYGTLPIGKTNVVIGRYIFAILFVGINGIIAGGVAFVISLIINSSTSQLTTIAYISVAFIYFCFFIAVVFPIYFKLPFSKAYIIANLPFYLLIIAGVFVWRKTDILNNLNSAIQYFTDNQNMLWLSALGIGLVLLIISCPISIAINKKNEL
jgi:hypothetical protein